MARLESAQFVDILKAKESCGKVVDPYCLLILLRSKNPKYVCMHTVAAGS